MPECSCDSGKGKVDKACRKRKEDELVVDSAVGDEQLSKKIRKTTRIQVHGYRAYCSFELQLDLRHTLLVAHENWRMEKIEKTWKEVAHSIYIGGEKW
eukprot:9201616-Karenia_brevis.AAC.1